MLVPLSDHRGGRCDRCLVHGCLNSANSAFVTIVAGLASHGSYRRMLVYLLCPCLFAHAYTYDLWWLKLPLQASYWRLVCAHFLLLV